MKHNQWKYSQKLPIKTYKDINAEIERAELHQKFLLEILDNDKELLKKAYSVPNLIQSGIISLTGNQNESGIKNILDNNMFLAIVKWIMTKFF